MICRTAMSHCIEGRPSDGGGNRRARARQSGFSMVELLVGMVIALLGTLAIFQVFALSEGQKRSTTSASDSQQNGSIALLSIERDIRQAGFGIFDAALLGCTVSLYDQVRAVASTFIMAPVVITQTANQPDSKVKPTWSLFGRK